MKKLYLRIQALVLVILIIVTTFVVNPQQVQADATVTADEESIPDLSTAESQSDSEQPETEPEITENTDVFPESANEANPETDIIPVNESSDIALITEAGTDDKAPEPAVEPTTETETETNPSASPSEQTIDKVDEVDTSSGVDTVNEAEPLVSDTEEEPATESISECEDQSTESDVERSEEANEDMNLSIETTEPEQVSEDVVMDKPDDQDEDIEMQDPAERSMNPRSYTPEKYFTFDPKTGTITKYSSVGPNNVNIPPNIGGVPVLAIGEGAFEVRTITSVTFPNTVRYIGDYAFSTCDLTDVKIPDNVIQIGEGAFIFNKLTSVSISNNITEISERAFESNQLKSVKIPDNVTVIGKWAFCKNELTSITIPNKVTEIKAAAFAKNQISSLTISKSVKMIDFNAFGDNLISNLTIPGNVLTIGSNSFANNTLENLSISNGVKQIYSNAFEYNYLTSVNIPDSVEYIGEAAFSNNELENLTLGKGLTMIEKRTFAHNYLESVTIPNNITEIRDYAFYDNNLADVTISNRVTNIGYSAFYSNYLTNIVIPSSVTIIGNKAFKDNPDLRTAKIPFNFDSITDTNADEITFVLISNPSIAQIGEYCFDPGVTFTLTGYIKAGSNIRRTPGGTIIATLKMPIYITGTDEGNYLKFTYNGQTAYVHKSAITTIPQPITGYTKSTANVRSSPNGNIIGSLSANERVSGTLAGNWVKFTYSGQTGYIYASLLKAPVTRYVKAGSNIRRTPTGTIIERLKMPIFVTGTIAGNYLKFIHKGQTAYVHVNLATTVSPPITGYAKQKINVRSAPNGSVIGSLSKGRKVSGSLVGNWVRFTYSGNNGYVYSSLLQADPVKLTCYVKAGSNIRSVSGGTIIARLKMPIFVTGTISGNTLRFTYKGKAAYVAMSVITSTSPPITGYTKSTVNVRSTPNGSVIGTLPANRKVSGVLVGQWVKFTYSGRTGYISASLLK